jgi:hypothetical protein
MAQRWVLIIDVSRSRIVAMRRGLLGLVLVFGLLVPGCFYLHISRTYQIREVMLSGGGIQYNGKGHFESVTLKADGTAVRRKDTFEHDFPKTGEVSTVERAEVSPEAFGRLAKAINDNHFFSKAEREGVVMDANGSLTVVYDGGEKSIQTLGREDSEIDAMLRAFADVSGGLEWKEVKE